MDTELNKVTVTGNVTTEEVIRVLQKVRKTASAWDEDQAAAVSWSCQTIMIEIWKSMIDYSRALLAVMKETIMSFKWKEQLITQLAALN